MLEEVLQLLLRIKEIQKMKGCAHPETSSTWRQVHDLMVRMPPDELDILAELSHEVILGCSETAYAAWCVSLPNPLCRASVAEFSFVVKMLPSALHDRPIEDLELGAAKNDLLKQNNIHTVGDLIAQAKKSGALPADGDSIIAEGISKIGCSDMIH
jgi:hypothetical protein